MCPGLLLIASDCVNPVMFSPFLCCVYLTALETQMAR